MRLTHHASIRCQQRGIPPLICDWLQRYGAESKTAGGGVKRFFDSAAKRRIAQEVGAQVVDRMGALMNLYLVEAPDERIITAGVRTRRFKRN